MRLLKYTLEGIESLHNMGIMHRDITLKNMLIVSSERPEAVLCDFGKATSEPFSGTLVLVRYERWHQRCGVILNIL